MVNLPSAGLTGSSTFCSTAGSVAAGTDAGAESDSVAVVALDSAISADSAGAEGASTLSALLSATDWAETAGCASSDMVKDSGDDVMGWARFGKQCWNCCQGTVNGRVLRVGDEMGG